MLSVVSVRKEITNRLVAHRRKSSPLERVPSYFMKILHYAPLLFALLPNTELESHALAKIPSRV